MQRYGYRLWIILMVGVLWGCIREKNGQCNSEIVIYVSVDDSALQSRSASGDNGNVDHTKIYIYGADLKLQRIVNYSRYDMDNRTRVRMDFPEGEHPTVVVWGNLNGAQEMAGTDAGEPLSAPQANTNGSILTTPVNGKYFYDMLNANIWAWITGRVIYGPAQ